MNQTAYNNAIGDTNTSWSRALRSVLVLTLLCGGIYPAVTTVVAGTLFPWQASGSIILRDGEAVGSDLVGQPFSSPRYFYGRPSAADHDPTAVVGSNMAPMNPALRERARQHANEISEREDVPTSRIPVDLIAASGSGIDPHISPEAAYLQAERVARARELSVAKVRAAIERRIEGPVLAILGQRRVNVLQLNLALDAGEGA